MNPEQGRAVATTDGPLLILAGAGSGKTRVIAHRIAYLIGVKAVRPHRILAVTFTNRAAGELRERIAHLVGDVGKDVEAGTFHALCARVLRRDGEAIGISRRFVIYDTDDQQQLMKRILAEEDLPATGEFRPAAILGAISRAKNEMLDETFLAQNAVNHRERTIAKLAKRYRERLEAARALDFDDLLLKAVVLFDEAPDVLAQVPGALAVPPRRRVPGHEPAAVPVGPCPRRRASQPVRRRRRRPVDLRLARGQRPEHPRLRARLPGRDRRQARAELPLDAAHPRRGPRRRLAQRAADRQEAVDARTRAACPIQRFEAFNEDEEAEWIARQTEGLIGQTGRGSWLTRRADDDETTRFRPKDVAVMYRMNAQSRAIEESFLRYGIRYQLVGGTRFYQRREVKDALAYLRVLRSDTDGVSFERIVNVPARGIGDKTRRGAPALGRAARRQRVPGGRGRGARRGRGDRAADPDVARRVRGARGAAADAGRRPAAARAAGRGPRAVGLPGDARRRLRGGRGPLGEPARAAGGHDPLRRPVAGRRAGPAARGDRARRRPGLVRGRVRRRDADHAPRGEGPRVPDRVHRRPRGGAVPAQPGARRREGAGGGAATRVRRDHPREASACSCPTRGAARRGAAAG